MYFIHTYIRLKKKTKIKKKSKNFLAICFVILEKNVSWNGKKMECSKKKSTCFYSSQIPLYYFPFHPFLYNSFRFICDMCIVYCTHRYYIKLGKTSTRFLIAIYCCYEGLQGNWKIQRSKNDVNLKKMYGNHFQITFLISVISDFFTYTYVKTDIYCRYSE